MHVSWKLVMHDKTRIAGYSLVNSWNFQIYDILKFNYFILAQLVFSRKFSIDRARLLTLNFFELSKKSFKERSLFQNNNLLHQTKKSTAEKLNSNYIQRKLKKVLKLHISINKWCQFKNKFAVFQDFVVFSRSSTYVDKSRSISLLDRREKISILLFSC